MPDPRGWCVCWCCPHVVTGQSGADGQHGVKRLRDEQQQGGGADEATAAAGAAQPAAGCVANGARGDGKGGAQAAAADDGSGACTARDAKRRQQPSGASHGSEGPTGVLQQEQEAQHDADASMGAVSGSTAASCPPLAPEAKAEVKEQPEGPQRHRPVCYMCVGALDLLLAPHGDHNQTQGVAAVAATSAATNGAQQDAGADGASAAAGEGAAAPVSASSGAAAGGCLEVQPDVGAVAVSHADPAALAAFVEERRRHRGLCFETLAVEVTLTPALALREAAVLARVAAAHQPAGAFSPLSASGVTPLRTIVR